MFKQYGTALGHEDVVVPTLAIQPSDGTLPEVCHAGIDALAGAAQCANSG